MKPWTDLNCREQLRTKADPTRFKKLWDWQYNNRLFGEAVSMLKSCICGRKPHTHVAIEDLAAWTGLGIADLARVLSLTGDINPGEILTGCPEEDPAKTKLVSEMLDCRRPRSPEKREDLHPYALTFRFQICEGGGPVRLL